MQSFRRSLTIACVAASFSLIAANARAVILYRTATRNTSAPTGDKLNSGWQWAGNFGSFLGTPIARNFFITAEHIGGGVGQNLVLNGHTYHTTAMYDDPTTDLRIFKVRETFSSWAPIYTGTSETGKWALTFGRGTQRGSAVIKNGVTKGWKWGTDDRVKSWGANTVAGSVNGGTGRGQLLDFTFNRNSNLAAEASLSTGDSSGPVFIHDGSTWKLAGINYLVDGPFSLNGANGSGFQASIFDKGGLYIGGDGAWRQTADTSADIPGQWYATRISSRQAWIRSIINSTSASSPQSAAVSAIGTAVPEPASVSLLLVGAGAALLRRRRR